MLVYVSIYLPYMNCGGNNPWALGLALSFRSGPWPNSGFKYRICDSSSAIGCFITEINSSTSLPPRWAVETGMRTLLHMVAYGKALVCLIAFRSRWISNPGGLFRCCDSYPKVP